MSIHDTPRRARPAAWREAAAPVARPQADDALPKPGADAEDTLGPIKLCGCPDFTRTHMSRRRLLGTAAAGAGALRGHPDGRRGLPAGRLRRRARRQRGRRPEPARGSRRSLHGGAARRGPRPPRRLPPNDLRAREHAPRRRHPLRAAPCPCPADAVLERRHVRRRPRRRSAGAEPLALLRDGGAGAGRARHVGPHRLAGPDAGRGRARAPVQRRLGRRTMLPAGAVRARPRARHEVDQRFRAGRRPGGPAHGGHPEGLVRRCAGAAEPAGRRGPSSPARPPRPGGPGLPAGQRRGLPGRHPGAARSRTSPG